MKDRNSNPDLILWGGRVTTLDRANPLAAAVAMSKGKFPVRTKPNVGHCQYSSGNDNHVTNAFNVCDLKKTVSE